MTNDFIRSILLEKKEVSDVAWKSESVIEITREAYPPFQAVILRERLVDAAHVEPYLKSPVAVIANFPKIGRWTGSAIELCESHGMAWGQWSVLLRSLGNENPETTANPEISFNRRALSQHSRVTHVSFLFDHVLLVHHEKGNVFRVGLLYEYDLCGDDVRKAWNSIGPFDLLLKTNPNGSILNDANEVAKHLGIKVFGLGDILGYLAKGQF